MPLCYRQANLNSYPKILELSHSHVSLGDLHGNALKLIYSLIEEGFLHINREDYDILKTIYFKPVQELTEKDLSEFKQIIQKANMSKKRALTLIGDDLADRGQNDYFTLLVLQKLQLEGINLEVLLSNHGVEFIQDYEREQFSGHYDLGAGQGESLWNMYYLIRQNLVDEHEIRTIVEQSYRPLIKALNYTVSLPNELTLFSHAPIGLETVKAIAEKFNLPYLDTHLSDLIKTIEAINSLIQQVLKQNKLARLIKAEGSADLRFPIPLIIPLQRLIWNRALGNELVTRPAGHFKVRFVHGHVGPQSILKNGHEVLPDHENLDNLFGKAPELRKTDSRVEHFSRQSSELTAKELDKLWPDRQ
ncbi:hypothetical protein BN59_01295 [Legionella massiliensis]|uniref:WipA-like phosphatase domain-containing protein n=1 Tax=Legionella massiliensis TaxID=1034943 RepID=A0A078KVK6_9GAMM|nr:Dot/Icm T4SS effector Wip [Legionella massiliensis]CDZ77016.1 hypothetical protein BN59_01295 [Legionella massiliensis]CEE12754.1 hypothetical protein BN1094_01295 [Legionella massiliensis]